PAIRGRTLGGAPTVGQLAFLAFELPLLTTFHAVTLVGRHLNVAPPMGDVPISLIAYVALRGGSLACGGYQGRRSRVQEDGWIHHPRRHRSMYTFAVVALLGLAVLKIADLLEDFVPGLSRIHALLTYALAVAAAVALDYSMFKGFH